MPEAIFQQCDAAGKVRWFVCEQFAGAVQARTAGQVLPALEAVEKASQQGLYAAGYVAYEAAAGIDGHFDVQPADTSLPLVWFGLFKSVREVVPPRPADAGKFSVGAWQATVSREEYGEAISRIKAYIASGDTYQVNYTLRLRAAFEGDARALFWRLSGAQKSRYCAYLDTGQHVICSASPELFFSLDGGVLTSRPMKGTAPRGLTYQEDRALQGELAASAKNRSENAMIVDMMRNDLGRIACPGSVNVSDLFRVEQYPTVLQMTSTVTVRTDASLVDIFRALFPCASITGAPKIRTMQIIRELESQPRGVYTGCVGCVRPGGKAEFNVAIRTVTIDRGTGRAEYGVGSGIVWDSQTADEYAECLTKTAVLTSERQDFELLETMLWEPEKGYFLLEGHLRRLEQSAEYFDFCVDLEEIARRLEELAARFSGTARKVRLRVNAEGAVTVEHAELDSIATPYKLRLARQPIGPRSVFLHHKTTNRQLYEAIRSGCRECGDVILWNGRREITETTIANIVLEIDGQLYTPPVECGLLGGVFRSQLLETGQVREKVLTVDDLYGAKRIFAVNSVRRWMPAVLCQI